MESITPDNIFEFQVWVNEFGRLNDLCQDWLIRSWDLKDEDKKIALLYYQKADKERRKWLKRWKKLC